MEGNEERESQKCVKNPQFTRRNAPMGLRNTNKGDCLLLWNTELKGANYRLRWKTCDTRLGHEYPQKDDPTIRRGHFIGNISRNRLFYGDVPSVEPLIPISGGEIWTRNCGISAMRTYYTIKIKTHSGRPGIQSLPQVHLLISFP